MHVLFTTHCCPAGDATMPNRNNNDKARANFNARHGCDSKKDKTKAGYCEPALEHVSLLYRLY